MVGVKRFIAFILTLVFLTIYTSKEWLSELFYREEHLVLKGSKLGRRAAKGSDSGSSGGGSSSSSSSGGGSGAEKGSAKVVDEESTSARSECAGVVRAEYKEALVRDMVSQYGKFPEGSWHSNPDPACPRFVAASQNQGAGIGHRLVAYSMALHVALWWNLTFAHTSLDGGGGAHGNYNGWDSWLAFTVGEWGFDDVLKRPGIRRVALPSLGGYYQYNEIMIARWKDAITSPDNCNVLFDLPLDNWAYDVSSTTKFLLSLKFSHAMQRHLTGAGLGKSAVFKAPDMPALVFDPAHVHVAVHIRIGDQYPTPEHVEARVVRETILPELAASGLQAPVHIHVFAEKGDAATFPVFAALPNVHFYPEMPALDSFYHMTQADFFVGSFSSFSFAVAQVALKPLTYQQPSSDIFRMCGDASVCCMHSGDCWPTAKYRTKLVAQRLATLERCGALEREGKKIDGWIVV